MLAQLPNNSYLCKRKDSRGVATRRKRQTDSLSLLSFVGIKHNVGSMKEQEIWKPVVGFEGYYEVSNLGRVRSVDRIITYSTGVKTPYKGKVISSIVTQAYLQVNLQVNQRRKMAYVHRLVAEAFIPNPDSKKHVDHINGDKLDNRVENLRWATPRENQYNPVTVRRHREMMAKRVCKSIKRVYQYDLDMNLINTFSSIADAGRQTGINTSSIVGCCRNRQYKNTAGGYIWRYADEDINKNQNSKL